jgi:hypothetical protein
MDRIEIYDPKKILIIQLKVRLQVGGKILSD